MESYFLEIFLLLITVAAGTSAQEQVKDLKLAVVVYRHGDRSAMYAYPTDPYGEGIWPDGFGQLTTRGIRQQYQLGKFLRNRYGLLLGPNVTTNQILIESSGVSRTLKSAAANAAGLIPPTAQMAWDKEGTLGSVWQPVPIFSRLLERDAIFSYSCPQWQELKNTLGQLPELIKLKHRFTDLMQYIQNHTKLKAFHFPRTFYSINDILYCQTEHGYPLPPWVTPEVQRDIKFMADVVHHNAAGGNDHHDVTRPRIRGGNMLRLIMEALARRANGSTVNEDVRLHIYSAHDENIAALLAALHLFDFDADKGHLIGIPNYASCLMFELFLNNSVRISFKNDKPDEPAERARGPVVLRHPQCTTFCPVDELVKLAQPYFMGEDEWFEACKLSTQNVLVTEDNAISYSTKIGIGAAVFVCAVIVGALIIFGIVRSSRRSRRRKQESELYPTQRLPEGESRALMPDLSGSKNPYSS